MKRLDSNYAIQYRGKLKNYNLNNYIHAYDNGYWEASGEQINVTNHFPFSDVEYIRSFNSTLEIPDELLDVLRHVDKQKKVRNSVEMNRRYNGSDNINSILNAPVENTEWKGFDRTNPGSPSNYIRGNYFPVKGILEIQSDDDFTIQTFHRLPDASVWTRTYDKKENKWTSWASEVPSILAPDKALNNYGKTLEDERKPGQVLDSFRRGVTGYEQSGKYEFKNSYSGPSQELPRQLYQTPIKTKDGKELKELSILNHFHKFNGTMTDMELLQYIHKKVLDYLSYRESKLDDSKMKGGQSIKIGTVQVDIPNFYSLEDMTDVYHRQGSLTYLAKKNGKIEIIGEGTSPGITIQSRFYKNDNLRVDSIRQAWSYDNNEIFPESNIQSGMWTNNSPMELYTHTILNGIQDFYSNYGQYFFMRIFGKNTVEKSINAADVRDTGNLSIDWHSFHKPVAKDGGSLIGILSTNNELFGYRYGEPSPVIGGKRGVPEYRFEIPNTSKLNKIIQRGYDPNRDRVDVYSEMVSAILLKITRINEDEPSETFLGFTNYIYIKVDEYFEDRIFPIDGYQTKFDNGKFVERGIKITYKNAKDNLDYIYLYSDGNRDFAYKCEVIIEQ